MDYPKIIDQIEAKFQGSSWEENRETIAEYLSTLHKEISKQDTEEGMFSIGLPQPFGNRLGGIYIPYMFWEQLSRYYIDPDKRIYLQKSSNILLSLILKDYEQKMMKPLLITYFAIEKEFELNKLKAQVLKKHILREGIFQ